MTERHDPAGSGAGKKKTLAIIGAAAALLLLTAGTAVGVQRYNGETSQRCADATAAVQNFTTASAATVAKAATVRALADGATGYDKSDGAASLLTGVEEAKQDLADTAIGTECASRDDAAALVSAAEKAAAKAAALDEVTVKLSHHVTVFQEAETKRIADKKAAEEASAAAKEAEDEAAAKQAEEAAAASAAVAARVPAAVQAPAVPRYAPAPAAPYVPAPAKPAPVPVRPAPAPAPAPGTGGGWTPPPPGAGGGGGCTQIGDHVMCSK